jgi:tripeptidyl-peptidase-1
MCQKRWHGTTIGCAPREVVCSAANGGIITSGGGFSNVYAKPSYQSHAVGHYLERGAKIKLLPHKSFFNQEGRGCKLIIDRHVMLIDCHIVIVDVTYMLTFVFAVVLDPDVTAYGTAFPILMNGTVVPVAGTSASTPVVASILALWNDELLNAGFAPVGCKSSRWMPCHAIISFASCCVVHCVFVWIR